MVVLAAAIVSKTGKALVSRQYMDMSRIRIEGLLAAFPKLVGTGKQHTYVETENVRYVYQPMEGVYLLLVTNKQSNILEDLDTLRLLSKLVPEYASTLEEELICKNAFELVFAFDEVISLGIRDNVTVQQVKQNCEMESHEEKLHKMLIQSKINDTKDLMKKKAMEIEKQKLDQQKAMAGSGFMRSGGFGSSGSKLGAMGSDVIDAPMFSKPTPPAPISKPTGKGPSKGMKLGTSKKNDLLEGLAKEGEFVEAPTATGAFGGAAELAAAPSEPVSLNVDEKLNVHLGKEGSVEGVEIQGTLSLVVHSDEAAFLRVALATGDNRAFQFKTHPNIDKSLYNSSNILGLKDPSRPFPTGSELGVLKWFCKTKDEAFVPLTINCWPSLSGAQSYVNVEYESTATYDLQNVTIAIPIPGGQPPTVNQIDGEWRYDSRRGVVLWTIELIDDTNRSGAMEFVTPSADSDSFFPIEISFSSTKTFCEVEVAGVENTQTGAPIKFSSNRLLQTAQYQVV